MVAHRKKSPRAPSIDLPEAVEKIIAVYDKEGRHTVASAVVAQDIGYKDATSGAALSALAAIKYYGLLDSPARGQLVVSSDVEEYKYSTSERAKEELLIKWLMFPKVYSSLLEAFPDRMPSDAALKYELIKMGFVEKTANSCLKKFKISADFAGYYSHKSKHIDEQAPDEDNVLEQVLTSQEVGSTKQKAAPALTTENVDRILIRLAGGRKAWLEVPLPFYEGDKEIIKKYVEIIIADEEE